jgi:transposase
MANHPAAPLLLRQGDRKELTRLARSTSVRAGLAQRARIVLLAAEGISNTAIAEKVGTTRNTVIAWRARYSEAGIEGLADADRSGRPRRIDHRAIVAATLRPPPKKLGVTHWSLRLLATRLGLDHTTVAKAWREYGVAPWRAGTFKFCTDPELVAKVVDVVGLYPAPPTNAVVLYVDEKSQFQAFERTAPSLPMQPGKPARATHDYVRHGTSTLFAALEIATGHVRPACKPRHRRQEFLAFLKQVARAYPEGRLHLVMDNHATHKTPEVRQWLAANPRFQVHFTPMSASWLNLVEVWFSIIERQALHRADVSSAAELNKRIRAFITGWNDRCHPFVWTKSSTEILNKANRQMTPKTGH